MDWSTWLIVIAAIAAFLLFKQLGQIGAQRARDYLRQGAKVIDVRSPAEFQSGHLPDAINIPLGDLQEQTPKQVPNRETVLLLHCLSGTRSGLAQRVLRRMGYAKSFNLGSYRRAERIVRG